MRRLAQIGRAAALALGSVAVMAVAAEGLPLPFSKGAAKRKVTLFVDGTGCGHSIEAKPARLQKAKQGAIGWRVRNECGIQRRVALCLYDAKGQRANPFGACASVPPGLGLGAPFTLAAGGGSAEIDCPAEQEGAYTAVVLVGDMVKGMACPASPPRERLLAAGEPTHNQRLAIEIVP